MMNSLSATMATGPATPGAARPGYRTVVRIPLDHRA
jgi:hypothetical protein